MDKIDLDELERLHAAATPGPWSSYADIHIKTMDGWGIGFIHHPLRSREEIGNNVAYIVAACNAVPELIAENRALQERVWMLEKALIELVKIEVSLPECAVCWERDQCTDRSHGDNCLAVGYIVDMAKEAAKEDGE